LFEAVIFDCDGVIVDSEVIAVDVGLTALAEVGLYYDRSEFVNRFIGMSTREFHEALDADGLQQLGRTLMPQLADVMYDRMKLRIEAELTEVPGATSVIAKLNQPKAIASSSTVLALDRKLKHVGLWDCFAPHIYSADHVARAKPAPDLFLHAAENLGVRPDRCLVLEDSVNGVKGARAAGMHVWGFLGGGHIDKSTGPKLTAAGATRLVPEWASFAAMLEG